MVRMQKAQLSISPYGELFVEEAWKQWNRQKMKKKNKMLVLSLQGDRICVGNNLWWIRGRRASRWGMSVITCAQSWWWAACWMSLEVLWIFAVMLIPVQLLSFPPQKIQKVYHREKKDSILLKVQEVEAEIKPRVCWKWSFVHRGIILWEAKMLMDFPMRCCSSLL